MEREVYTVNLPDIGEGVVEGEIIEWLKEVGSPIKQNEPVVVVMTDKATVELSAPYSGKIFKHYYQQGEISIRDKPLYDIELPEGEVATKSKEKKAKESSFTPTLKSDVQDNKAAKCVTHQVLATPKIRHLAYGLGIDIETIQGTGPEGRVTYQDLTQPSSSFSKPHLSSVKQLEGDEILRLHGIRAAMARKFGQVSIPQFSYCELVDATQLVKQRLSFKEKMAAQGINLSYMPYLIFALSQTIKAHPEINASIEASGSAWIKHHLHHIGVATASLDGLIVPVLKDVQEMNLNDVIYAFEELKKKAISGSFSATDMKDATITISNFGTLGNGLWATPMINQGEVAILAVGKIRKDAVVKNGQIVIGEQIPFSWSFDHRLIDGEMAAKISTTYCQHLLNLEVPQ